MTAVILNGAGKNDKAVDDIQEMLVEELSGLNRDTKPFILRELNITHCVGCFGCWVKTPGVCRFDDDGRKIAEETIHSDLSIWLTPVTFGGYSSELKKALDRIICLLSPFFTKINGETHHKLRYDRYPRLMAIGVLPDKDPESEAIFRTLIARNALNFHSVSHSGGIVYHNQKAVEQRKTIQSLLTAVEVSK